MRNSAGTASRPRWRAVLGATAVLAALGISSVHPATAAARSVRSWPADADVAVVGDSLTYGEHFLGNQVRAYRNAGLSVAVDATGGRFASGGIAVLRRVGQLPGIVVFALGTNDSCASATPYLHLLNQARTLSRESTFMAVTLHVPKCRRSATLNSQIRAFAASHKDVVVADWAKAASKNPSWMAADGVHLTTQGYRARASFLAAAVAAVHR